MSLLPKRRPVPRKGPTLRKLPRIGGFGFGPVQLVQPRPSPVAVSLVGSNRPLVRCRNGRTPEEEFLYRVDNGIPLRDTRPTEEERLQSIHRILEEDRELLQMLADA